MATQVEHERVTAAPDPAPADPNLAARGGHASAHDHRLRNRVLRVRIFDVDTGRLKVNLALPAGLVGVATRLGARLAPGRDPGDLVEAIERDELRAPFVVDDEENGERVEITLEG